MCRIQSVLALVVLFLGLVHSWDFAIANGDLLEFYINNAKTDTVRFKSQNLAALVYDEVHNMILYVDKQSDNDAIYGFNMSSMQYKYLIERNGRNIQGLAFDPATELLFFTDTKERSINWISLKPGAKNNVYGNVLIKMDNGIPTDIAVDICRGFIYWINTNLTIPAIERARFNGSEREVVINPILLSINTTYKLEPHSLALDQQTQSIHWIDYESTSHFNVYTADLNGKNKKKLSENYFYFLDTHHPFSNFSNVFTISKESLLMIGWCPTCVVWNLKKIPGSITIDKSIIQLSIETPGSIVAKYTVSDQIQGINDCKALKSLVQNNSLNSDPHRFASQYVGEYCVHGVQVTGQSLCKCAPGYIGERCDVSVCENYCIQGSCGLNDDGLPKCSCNAGYSGVRCEINACFGYCLNNGDCSLNEEDEPVCQCVGNHEGSRCETVSYETSTKSFPAVRSLPGGNPTFADLFSKWKKPVSKMTVILESS